MERIQRNKNSFFCVLLLFIAFSFSLLISPVKASADTTEYTGLQAQEIIDESMFVTFRKGESTSLGKFIFASYYIPNEYYDTNCVYGLLIFPTDYIERFIKEKDYIREFKEQSIAIMEIENNVPLASEDGQVFKCGIAGIMEQNLGREFSFIFYAKDPSGQVAYSTPAKATYNTLLADNITDSELLEILDKKLTMRDNFVNIVDKIEELVDAVWIYLVVGCASIVVVWGAYIGIRVAVAKRKEEQINARGMVKSLILGIIIAFVLACAMPLFIKGLAAWLV